MRKPLGGKAREFLLGRPTRPSLCLGLNVSGFDLRLKVGRGDERGAVRQCRHELQSERGDDVGAGGRLRRRRQQAGPRVTGSPEQFVDGPPGRALVQELL